MIISKRLPLSYIFGRMKWKIVLVAILSTVSGLAGDWLDEHANIEHPVGIPAFVGTALVFILAFRTNQAYDRWWEARKIWGAIVNDNRSLARMILTLARPENNPIKQRVIRRQIGWNHLLTKRLRNEGFSESDLAHFPEAERQSIVEAFNPTQLALKYQSEDLASLLREGNINELHHFELENILTSLEASMGKAERIKNTVFPVLYDWIIHMAIYLFAALLSLAIVDSSHVFEIAFTVIVATIFLALEQISIGMQDPFENLPSDTPMTAISHSIERGLLQLLGETELPEEPQSGKFWLN